MWTEYAILFAAFALVRTQQGCLTPDNSRGVCVRIGECEPLRELVTRRPTPQQADYLRRSLCGYDGRTPKVCCPQQEPQPPQPPQPWQNSPPCYTPDGLAGSCLDVKNCPLVVRILQQKPIPPQQLEYIRRLRCNGPAAYSVCCAPDGSGQTGGQTGGQSGGRPDVATSPPAAGSCALSATLPQAGCCGVEGAGGNRIIGGNETNIDQYPWMALVEYRRADNRIRTLCGGALISGKYVLTAGHCVVGDVLKSGRPVNIRLGEYDTSTAQDCVPADGGGTDCADPVVTLPIERTIPHPQYDPNAALRRNDIALIRMASTAPYTDFIRPICLPRTDSLSTGSANLWAAGWGATNSTTSSSNKKLHVQLPYKSLADCQKQYSVPRRNIKLWSKQLCAGGVKDKDSCKGDSGGPLMLERGSTFEIVGVVSFGTTPCGMENVPGVYTKVYEYAQWIQGEVKR